MSRIDLRPGDCREALAALPPASVDAIVTDPPYHLASIVARFGGAEAAEAREGTDGLFRRASSGFMGKAWDGGDIAFDPDFWRLCLRVLKPGGHLAAFNHSKQFDLMASAIRRAGFEVRDSILSLYSAGGAWREFLAGLSADQADALGRALAASDGPLLAWLYGSGFPKSHDVARGIDSRKDWGALARLQGEIAKARKRLGISQSEAARRAGLIGPGERLGGGGFMWFETGRRVPTREEWPRLREALALSADLDAAFEEAERETVGEHGDAGLNRWNAKYSGGEGVSGAITRSARDLSAEWEGWGTALKPAFEPILLARKPIEAGSIAAQVLATGTGAINVAAGRIPMTESDAEKINGAHSGMTPETYRREPGVSLNLSVNPMALKPASAHELGRWPANVVSDGSAEVIARLPADPGGSVGRFFYSAKADAGDRRGSAHPTVKPQSLMRWLVRLLTPPGGLVLDPFGGSGATGWAAAAEGFRAILCEREPEYLADIRRNIARLEGDIDGAEARFRAEIARLADLAAAEGSAAEAARLRKRLEAIHPDDEARAEAAGAPAGAALGDLFGGRP